MTERVTGVVLAAGSSRRMGTLKQLLPWGDTTVLGQTISNLKQSRLADVLVVIGHDPARVASEVAQADVTFVTNPDHARGEMLSSLQTAIPYLDPDCRAIVVMLADQPMVGAKTINRLLDAYTIHRHKLIAPAFRGRRGNPVLIDRHFFPKLLQMPWDKAPRDLLRQHPHELYLVDVESDAILRDLDHPEDYLRERPRPTGVED